MSWWRRSPNKAHQPAEPDDAVTGYELLWMHTDEDRSHDAVCPVCGNVDAMFVVMHGITADHTIPNLIEMIACYACPGATVLHLSEELDDATGRTVAATLTRSVIAASHDHHHDL